jgi:hypothetical protein
MDIHVNRWVLALVAALLVGGGVGVGLALSGGDDGDSDEPTSVATATDTTSELDEINKQLVGQLAREGNGKHLGPICLANAAAGRAEAAEEGKKRLGRLISSQGGDVTEVIDGLINKCSSFLAP